MASGYRIIETDRGTSILRESDGAFIPDDPFNNDYAEYRRWVLDGGIAAVEAAPRIIPPPISDRQFAQGLAERGLISNAEALAWVGPGTLPQAFVSFLGSLPPSDRFAAEIVLTGATEFRRDHPMVEAFGAMAGMDLESLDQFWLHCATL
jgi:hypothetical protein